MTNHPAKFSDSVLDAIRPFISKEDLILDPMAGIGRVHELHPHTIGIEIEKEWADTHPRTLLGNALYLPFDNETFTSIIVSPSYGNRMSDHHNARDASKRITYRHTLGRPLDPDNSGQLQWGRKYQIFHNRAWGEATRVLKPGGKFLLNISDHIRKGEVMPVSNWHISNLLGWGYKLMQKIEVSTPRMRYGANREVRTLTEYLCVFEKENL